MIAKKYRMGTNDDTIRFLEYFDNFPKAKVFKVSEVSEKLNLKERRIRKLFEVLLKDKEVIKVAYSRIDQPKRYMYIKA